MQPTGTVTFLFTDIEGSTTRRSLAVARAQADPAIWEAAWAAGRGSGVCKGVGRWWASRC